jgi:hypothetical protein
MTSLPPENGACKGKPTEWWFPLLVREYSGSKRLEQMNNKKKAIEICGLCPVRLKCLEYSLENEPFGVWGGKDEYERDVIRRRRGVPSKRAGSITVPGTGTRRVAHVQPHE